LGSKSRFTRRIRARLAPRKDEASADRLGEFSERSIVLGGHEIGVDVAVF
jgi:hypothetical protein